MKSESQSKQAASSSSSSSSLANRTIEYWPKQHPVKKSSKFDLPGPPTDSHGNVIGDNDIPIAVIDGVNKDLSSTSYKQQKLSPLFKALEKSGFKITSYEER